MGDNSGTDEPEKIREFKEKFSPYRAKMNRDLHDFMEKRGRKFDKKVAIDQPLNEETFTIYSYPLESGMAVIAFVNYQIRRFVL